jgi:hypothetical protein
MRATRMSAYLALVAAAAVQIGTSLRTGADAREALAAGERVSADLDVAAHHQRDCAEYQLRLVGELTAGRLPLAEAADDMLELSRARPRWLVGLANTFPTDPDDRVRVARVLVNWVKEVTAADPDRRGEAVGRVTAEFEEMTDAADD